MYHSFDTKVAELVGVNAAILFNSIAFWCEKNRANGSNIKEGRAWTFNTVNAFSELFPYMSKKQIATALRKLEETGLVVTGCFNRNPYDRTKWYALTEKGISLFRDGKIDLPKKENPKTEKVECTIPKTDECINSTAIYTVTNPVIDTDGCYTEPKAPKPKRHRYGEYGNVLLTDEELAKLKAEFPDFQERIERLSEYIASTGKRYKSHLATIRSWARKDQTERKSNAAGFDEEEARRKYGEPMW